MQRTIPKSHYEGNTVKKMLMKVNNEQSGFAISHASGGGSCSEEEQGAATSSELDKRLRHCKAA
jgi:hypothetical protein